MKINIILLAMCLMSAIASYAPNQNPFGHAIAFHINLIAFLLCCKLDQAVKEIKQGDL